MTYRINIGASTDFQIENNTSDIILTIDGDVVIVNDLTVSGTTTTINTATLTVEDPIIVTGTNNVLDNTDLGLVMIRNAGNVAMIYDESLDQFSVVNTSDDGSAAGDLTITSYADFQCAAFTSTGIDDNATGEALQLTNAIMALGNGTLPFDIGLKSDDQSLLLVGAIDEFNGASLRLYGDTEASNANDIIFGAGGVVKLAFDDSAGTWDFQVNNVIALTFESDVATGTAPFAVASTTLVSNLNADTVDGFEASAFPNRLDIGSDPTANDDIDNFQIGSLWVNTTSDAIFINVDNTDTIAIWKEISTGGGVALNDIIDDVTPQLGATLDMNAFGIDFSEIFNISLDTDIATGDAIVIKGAADGELTESAAEQTFLSIQPVINQTATASYRALHVDVTETLTGSGTKELLTLQVGTVDQFVVDNAGNLVLLGTVDGVDIAGNVLRRDGSQALTADWDAGAFDISAEQFHSDIAIGTAPFTVVSTDLVTNLNADTVDGVHAADMAQLGVAAEFTKTQNFDATSLTALGSDFAINGGFTTDTGWTKGTGWTIAADVASSDGTQGADSDLENDTVAPVAGNEYEVIYTVSGRTVGNVTAVVGATEGTDRATNATFTEYITATNTDVLKIRADIDFDGDIDNVSIRLANVSWDLADNQVTAITLDGNLVIDNPTNLVDGAIYYLSVLQDATGSRTVTWGTAFLWPGGTAPTLSAGANAIDVITFVCDGTNMLGKAELNYS